MKDKRMGIALALVCLAVAPVTAQEAEEQAAPAGPVITPIEIYACSFNEGKSMDDLMQVTAGWNAWMDSQQQTEYWAFVLVPVYHSADVEFDVAWVGGWPDGATMGASTEFWITQGGEYQKAFEEVADCNAHANFAVLSISPAPDPFGSGPVEFTDCKIAEGRTLMEAIGAVNQWVAYEGENGITRGHALLFPAYGESSDADYHFKWATRSSYETFGAAFDQYGTGGGWQQAQTLFSGLLDCDSARMYHGTAVRKVDLGE